MIELTFAATIVMFFVALFNYLPLFVTKFLQLIRKGVYGKQRTNEAELGKPNVPRA